MLKTAVLLNIFVETMIDISGLFFLGGEVLKNSVYLKHKYRYLSNNVIYTVKYLHIIDETTVYINCTHTHIYIYICVLIHACP